MSHVTHNQKNNYIMAQRTYPLLDYPIARVAANIKKKSQKSALASLSVVNNTFEEIVCMTTRATVSSTVKLLLSMEQQSDF